jgi:hypothetical protein
MAERAVPQESLPDPSLPASRNAAAPSSGSSGPPRATRPSRADAADSLSIAPIPPAAPPPQPPQGPGSLSGSVPFEKEHLGAEAGSECGHQSKLLPACGTRLPSLRRNEEDRRAREVPILREYLPARPRVISAQSEFRFDIRQQLLSSRVDPEEGQIFALRVGALHEASRSGRRSRPGSGRARSSKAQCEIPSRAGQSPWRHRSKETGGSSMDRILAPDLACPVTTAAAAPSPNNAQEIRCAGELSPR